MLNLHQSELKSVLKSELTSDFEFVWHEPVICQSSLDCGLDVCHSRYWCCLWWCLAFLSQDIGVACGGVWRVFGISYEQEYHALEAVDYDDEDMMLNTDDPREMSAEEKQAVTDMNSSKFMMQQIYYLDAIPHIYYVDT